MSQLDLGPAEPRTFTGEAGPIAALSCGPDDGPPVLLVPGFTGSKEDFGPLFAPLSTAGIHTVAIDLPGQYQSPGPGEPAGYSTAALADRVRSVAAELGRRVHLLGHSFGGLVCRAAALDAPGSFTSLTLLDSGPGALSGPRAERIQLLRPYLPQLGVAGVYEASETLAAAEPGYVAPPAALAAFLRTRFLAGSAAMLLGMGEALLAEPDRVDELAASGVPVLVLYGADDDAWPPAVQQDMARRLRAPHAEIPGAAHSPAVENPSATAAALLEFWHGQH